MYNYIYINLDILRGMLSLHLPTVYSSHYFFLLVIVYIIDFCLLLFSDFLVCYMKEVQLYHRLSMCKSGA